MREKTRVSRERAEIRVVNRYASTSSFRNRKNATRILPPRN